MNRTSTNLLRLMAGACALAIVMGVAPAAAQDECGEGELTYLANVTPNLTMEVYGQIIDRFREMHPGIEIQLLQASGTPHDEYAKLLLTTGSFPDVAGSLNNDRATFYNSDVLASLPLDEYTGKIRNVENELIAGELFAYAPFSQPIGLVFYNKEQFEAAGITDDMLPPADLAALEQILVQLRDAGFTPMAMANSWAAGWGFWQIAQPTVFTEEPNWYQKRDAGEVSFADGPWLRMAEVFSRWASEELIDPNALSTDYVMGQTKFLRGEAATWVMGSFFAGAEGDQDFEVGVFTVPGEAGQQTIALRTDPASISVSANAEPMVAALCFARFLATDPFANGTVAQADALFSSLKSPPELVFTPLQQKISDLIDTLPVAPTALGSGPNQPVAGFHSESTAVAEAIMQGSMTPLEAMQQLDAFWDDARR